MSHYHHIDRHNATLAEIAETLPDDKQALFHHANGAIARYHSAIMRGDESEAVTALDHYEAVIFSLNNGTMFGCRRDNDAPGYQVDRYCAARPGAVPMWGQCGDFLLEVQGMRVRVMTDTLFSRLYQSVSLHAVDLDRPFLSESGYRSTFVAPAPGVLVDAAVSSMISEQLDEPNGRRPIRANDRDGLVRRPVPGWLKAQLETQAPPQAYTQPSGQRSLNI